METVSYTHLDVYKRQARHYPAINWTISYSEYYEDLDPYYIANVGEDFCKMRGRMLGLLSEENKLMEIVKLIGSDAVSYTHLDVYKRQDQRISQVLSSIRLQRNQEKKRGVRKHGHGKNGTCQHLRPRA